MGDWVKCKTCGEEHPLAEPHTCPDGPLPGRVRPHPTKGTHLAEQDGASSNQELGKRLEGLTGLLTRIAEKCWQHPNDEPATKQQLEDALYEAHGLAVDALGTLVQFKTEAATALQDVGGGLGEEERERFWPDAIYVTDRQYSDWTEVEICDPDTAGARRYVRDDLIAALQSEDGSKEGRVVVELSGEEAGALVRCIADAHGYFEPDKCTLCKGEAKLRAALKRPGHE